MDTAKIISLFNSAQAHKDREEYSDSAKIYEEILSITTQLPEVYFNLSIVYSKLDKYKESIKCLEEFLKAEPNDIEAKYFLATHHFMLKDYVGGYELFESRISRQHAIITQDKTLGQIYRNIPFWKGENLTNKTIYVYYEAGLGDTLMYFRYLPLLAKRCKKVYFKPQYALLPLFAENKGDIQVIARFTPEMSKKCDYHCPIMSLPYFLGLDNKTVFYNSSGFLKASKKEENKYKTKYFNNDKLKIGIKWQGNTLIGGERAMTAQSFAKIFEIPNSQIYSVQVMGGAEQIKELQEKYNLIDLGSTFKDFSNTAGAIANMDIVICNDTSVGHLAGAMGKKTYIILPKHYDWRWHNDISKCDWYDSIKLYRQKTTWEEVIARIQEDIIKNKDQK